MKKIYLTLLICSMATTLVAQNSHMVFASTKHDFGVFSEDDKPRSFAFTFTNEGTAPIVITRTESTCGCTVPAYSKQPVMPGKSGVVTVFFHPKGHPGVFNRAIYLHTNASDKAVKLSVSGTVTPTKDKFSSYPYNAGGLRLKRMNVDFKEIASGSKRVERIEIVNGTSSALRLSFSGCPAHISCRTEPEVLGVDQIGDLVITYMADSTIKQGTFLSDILLEGLSASVAPSARIINIRATVR